MSALGGSGRAAPKEEVRVRPEGDIGACGNRSDKEEAPVSFTCEAPGVGSAVFATSTMIIRCIDELGS
jgi:hypothetical protein